MLNSINYAAKPISFGEFRVTAPGFDEQIKVIPKGIGIDAEFNALKTEKILANMIKENGFDVTVKPDIYNQAPELERKINALKEHRAANSAANDSQLDLGPTP